MKHSPMPKQLCSWRENNEGGFAEPLPRDLERLFRASPRLADACRPFARDRVPSLGGPKPHGDGNAYVAVTLEEHATLRNALALLED